MNGANEPLGPHSRGPGHALSSVWTSEIQLRVSENRAVVHCRQAPSERRTHLVRKKAGIAKSVFLAAGGATSSTPSPPATWCRPSVLHSRRLRPEDDGRIVFSVRWSGVTYAGLVYVGLWRSAESPITRPILGYRSRSTKGERAGRLQHHRGATGPAPRQHGRRWCPLTPQPRRRAAVPLFIASHAALFTCLPERHRTARTSYIHPQTHHRAVDGGR